MRNLRINARIIFMATRISERDKAYDQTFVEQGTSGISKATIWPFGVQASSTHHGVVNYCSDSTVAIFTCFVVYYV